MKKKIYDREAVERIRPLLRSIALELRDRRQAIAILEHEFALAQRQRRVREASLCQSTLANHKRQVRQVTKELAGLGLELDPANGLRILIPTSDGAWAYEGGLNRSARRDNDWVAANLVEGQ